MATALLILLLLLICGVIAYVGDWLGRRMGKKRLSIWGLRPRHTAILVTVVTGVVIALITIAAAVALLPGFRDVVRRGEQLVHDNRKLVNRKNKLLAKEKALVDEQAVLEQELVRVRIALSDSQESLRPLRAEQERLRISNSRLEAERGRLASTNRRLSMQISRLEKEQRTLTSQKARLTAQVDSLRENANLFETGILIARKGAPLTKPRPIPAKAPRPVIRRALDGLLEEARHELLRRHSAEDLRPAQPLYLLRAVGDAAGATDEARLRSEVIREAAGLGGENVVMRIRAAQNTPAGKSVPILVDVYVDERVYRAGEIVAASNIEAGASEGVVFGDMLDLLRKARTSALQPPRAIIPDESGEVGDVSFDELLAITRRVRSMGGTVLVQARAKQETRRSGPLNLEFALQTEPPQ